MNDVLLVTNNPILRKRIKLLLQSHNLLVLADANSMKAALDIYRKEDPPLVVTDLFMPGSSGIELIKILRKSDEHLLLFLISELRTKSLLDFAFRFGADEVFTLPFSDESFISCVLQRLSKNIAS